MWNSGLSEAQAGIKIAGRIPITSDKQMTLPLWERNWSASWWKWKRSLKNWLKIQHYKQTNKNYTKIVASSPVTSWQINGKTTDTVRDFLFLCSKIIAGGDCSHEIKICLLLGRKAVTNLDRIFKRRDITLLTRVHLVKAMVFPVVVHGCELDHKEGWAPKNWCFWTVVLEKTLESPLYCKELQPVLTKGNQSFSPEGLMLKLKFQYFGHLMWRADTLEKTMMQGKIEGRRRRGKQRMRWLNGITDSVDVSLSKLQ